MCCPPAWRTPGRSCRWVLATGTGGLGLLACMAVLAAVHCVASFPATAAVLRRRKVQRRGAVQVAAPPAGQRWRSCHRSSAAALQAMQQRHAAVMRRQEACGGLVDAIHSMSQLSGIGIPPAAPLILISLSTFCRWRCGFTRGGGRGGGGGGFWGWGKGGGMLDCITGRTKEKFRVQEGPGWAWQPASGCIVRCRGCRLLGSAQLASPRVEPVLCAPGGLLHLGGTIV